MRKELEKEKEEEGSYKYSEKRRMGKQTTPEKINK